MVNDVVTSLFCGDLGVSCGRIGLRGALCDLPGLVACGDVGGIGRLTGLDGVDVLGRFGRLRGAVEGGDVEGVRRAKLCLPAVTPMGCFVGRRCGGVGCGLTGVLCLDVDGVGVVGGENGCWGVDEALGVVLGLDYVWGAGVSCSGSGLYVLLRCGDLSLGNFSERYSEALCLFGGERFGGRGFVVDGSCRDVTRLRFVSPYVCCFRDGVVRDCHEVAVERGVCVGGGVRGAVWRGVGSGVSSGVVGEKCGVVDVRLRGLERRALRAFVDGVVSRGVDVTSWEPDWWGAGCCLAGVFGDSEEGVELFLRLSSLYGGFDEVEARRKYAHCCVDGDGRGAWWLLWRAERAGLILHLWRVGLVVFVDGDR